MGKSTISMAMFNSYLYVYQRVNNKFDLFEHVWHILLTAGWLWNPMISVILKVKLLWVCWSNPRKKRNPVTHSQKLLFCLLKPCLVKTVFFGEVPIKVATLRVSSWSNSHTLVDKPCFCWLNTCDWCFNRVYHSLDQHADPAMSFFIAVGGYFPLNMGFSQGVDTSLGSHVLGMATNLRPGA